MDIHGSCDIWTCIVSEVLADEEVERMKEIEILLKKLQSYSPEPNVFNQYSIKDPSGIIRLNNLRLYLNFVKPNLILIGEAAGYHGCRWSGIPFTSEHIMLNSEIPLFRKNEFKQSSKGTLKKEKSATIVWNTIKDFTLIPLLWNIFPFHPHELGNLRKNRTPTINEVELGKEYLENIRNTYPKAMLVAVGKVAQKKLKILDITSKEVRHPSFGGKKLFQKRLLKLKNEKPLQ